MKIRPRSLTEVFPVRLAFLATFVALLSMAPACGTPLVNVDARNRAPDAGEETPGETIPPDGSDGQPRPDARAPITFPVSHAVRIAVLPSDNAAALLAAIRGAKKSVHMTMYMLTNDTFMQALIDRKRAGLDVKVVLNKTFPSSEDINAEAFDKLSKAGVGVVWGPPGFTFTHSKCIILDGVQAWIMTMNATFTSPNVNREYLAIDDEPADVAQAETIFQGDFTNKAAETDGALVVSPVNSGNRLAALAAAATTSLDLEAESLADERVVASLTAAHDRGVKVRVVLSPDQSTEGELAAVAALKAKKVPVVAVTAPYIHAKAIVVDATWAYVGSINFTYTSIFRNREIGVITDAAPEVAKVSQTIASDFAKGKAL